MSLQAPSRLRAKDSTLFASLANAAEITGNLGWTNLASKPPFSLAEIAAIAAGVRKEGLDAVVLIGQGGSSQASMTITQLYEVSKGTDVAFRTLDCLSPVLVNHILQASNPARTLYIVSSKSGSTIEPLLLERVVWHYVSGQLGSIGAARRFVAITDPGSKLEQLALVKDYRFVFAAPKAVGGRFSALSIFALFPAALIGIDIELVVAKTALVEERCVQDSEDNPALDLACFIYANYEQGRDKISLVMPPSAAVFGLWLEQLIAESLGKQGKGILPNVEVDVSVLQAPHADRLVITYCIGSDASFQASLAQIDASTPVRHYHLDSVEELFDRFVIWEYAVVLLGLLMQINPFGQPDVEDTKKRVRKLLSKLDDAGLQADSPPAIQEPDYLELNFPETEADDVLTLRISRALLEQSGLGRGEISVEAALRALFAALTATDYFSLNAFLPFHGSSRRAALERMRNLVASHLGVAACLEIGPRYLHSTGQLHKGGPNNGVFCFLSAEEESDIEIPGEDFSLGQLATTQARGDFAALAARGRRAVQLHLAGNDPDTLNRIADCFSRAVFSL